MNDEAEIPTASPTITTASKKSRGRPAKATPETPQQRIDRLKAELQKAEEAKKAAEQQRDSIVGKAVVAHAFAHADFKRQLAGILRSSLKGKADLASIAELLT
jgi:flagellar hook-basal body complex protein FliE